MAELKTRYPYRLSDEDFDEWFTRWVAWFLAFPNTVENANWLRPGVYALDNDYHDKRIAAMEAEDAQQAASAEWRTAVKALRELLIKLRISLPTLTPGDDSVLDTFKLRGEVPEDADKLLDYAEIADNAWQPLSGDPQYAPFAGRLNLIAPSVVDVNTKRVVMGNAILAYSTATDTKTAARDACHTRERAVFNFFRGEGKDSTFWTSSVYGLGTGGEQPGGGAKYPAAVENLKVTHYDSPTVMNVIEYDLLDGADSYGIKKAEVPTGSPEPDEPLELYTPPVEGKSYSDLNIMPGMTAYYWVCGIKDGEKGEFAGPVSVKLV